MVDVVAVPALNALIVVVQEHEQGHADVGVDVGGRGVTSGDEAEYVLYGDEEEQAAEHGENLASVLAHVGDGEVLKPAYDRLEDVLHLAGDQRNIAAHKPADDKKDEHGHPRIEDVPEFYRLPSDGDMIQMNQFGDENRLRKSACHVCAPSNVIYAYDASEKGVPESGEHACFHADRNRFDNRLWKPDETKMRLARALCSLSDRLFQCLFQSSRGHADEKHGKPQQYRRDRALKPYQNHVQQNSGK